MAKEKISFVIPCYGSEHAIQNVISDIKKTVSEHNPYEIICVNDCSPDNVYSVLEKAAGEDENIKVINLARNFGQHCALMAGFHYVTGDIVVCLDDDGQTSPIDCYKLIEALNDCVDIAFAKYPSKKENVFRLFGSWTAKKMGQWLCSLPPKIEFNSYFACKRFIINEVVKYDNAYPFIDGLLIRVSNKIVNIDIEHHEREYGKSGYSLRKLISLWMNEFTSFSVKPLRIATVCGSLLSLSSLLYAVYIIIKKMLNADMPIGYSSIMCAILFVGGMLMIMLGLIGEYIGRIYIVLNKSPQFVIRNTLNIEKKDK